MDVKLVILQSLILDSPVFNRALDSSDSRRVVGIEEHRRRVACGDVEL